MKERLFLLLVGLVLLGSSIFGFIYEYTHCEMVLHTGEEVFPTEEEYLEFKGFCLQPEVEIENISLLASEPPIYARYSLVVPRNINFPYNVENLQPQSSTTVAVLTAFGVAVGVFFFCSFFASRG